MGSKKLFNIPANQGGIGNIITPGLVQSIDFQPTGLHIPVCFVEKTSPQKREHEINCLEKSLKSIPNLDFYISINGKSINDYYDKRVYALGKKYDAEIFHRDNIGYQWGGYYEFYKAHEFEYNWFGTLEADAYIVPDWRRRVSPSRKLHHCGMAPLKNNLDDDRLYKFNVPEHEAHTCGGFHLCSHKLLKAIDQKFHRFTDATGDHYMQDGILYGEVGFCSKILELGYALNPVDDLAFKYPVGYLGVQKMRGGNR